MSLTNVTCAIFILKETLPMSDVIDIFDLNFTVCYSVTTAVSLAAVSVACTDG